MGYNSQKWKETLGNTAMAIKISCGVSVLRVMKLVFYQVHPLNTNVEMCEFCETAGIQARGGTLS